MVTYETIFIVNPNVSSEEIETHIQKVTNIITERGGEVLSVERWGLRHLAYIVKKFNRGNYIFIKINADAKILDEIRRYYSITDNIIKSLTVQEKKHRIKGKRSQKEVLQQVKIEVGNDIISHIDE
ncbi:MAG: 30S ribosomal protein S6 [Candidatus Firestonebacteria bacterium]|nr:30S ribosomal protein S6 [Candidatus Firestonebacteria bacterium]